MLPCGTNKNQQADHDSIWKNVQIKNRKKVPFEIGLGNGITQNDKNMVALMNNSNFYSQETFLPPSPLDANNKGKKFFSQNHIPKGTIFSTEFKRQSFSKNLSQPLFTQNNN